MRFQDILMGRSGRTAAILLGAAIAMIAGTARGQDFPVMEELMVLNVPPVFFGAAAWGDLDQDGDFDLVYSGNAGTIASPHNIGGLLINQGDVWVNTADGAEPASDYTWRPEQNPYANDLWRGSVSISDADNDGDLDVVFTGRDVYGVNRIRIYEGMDFVDYPSPIDRDGLRHGALAWADINNDGHMSLFGTGQKGGRIVTYVYSLGGGSTTFPDGHTEQYSYLTGSPLPVQGVKHASMAWGDYDNDMDMDLLMSGVTDNGVGVSLYRNDGGNLSYVSGVGLEPLIYASAAWGDYDADGDLDILVSGARLSPFVLEGVVQVYTNEGGFFSAEKVSILDQDLENPAPGMYRGNVGWGDQNNDGFLDFFVTGYSSPTSQESGQIFHNMGGSGVFRVPDGYLKNGAFPGGRDGATFWGDYDGDNDLDMFSSGRAPGKGNVVRVFRNSRFGSNARPQPPTNLSASVDSSLVDETTVTFAWDRGSDAETPAPGLTYNLRVGTTPGGINVMSPIADVSTGHRYVSSMGNAQHNLGWKLKRNRPGVYYWAVQSVDASFAGSVFSEERTFTIE